MSGSGVEGEDGESQGASTEMDALSERLQTVGVHDNEGTAVV